MVDYEELIDELRTCAEMGWFCPCEMQAAADAIEKLTSDYEILAKMYAKVNEDLCTRTKDFNTAIADLKEISECTQCKHYKKSSCSNSHWEWRGANSNE